MCAVKGDPAEAAAVCNAARPQCTGFSAVSSALTQSSLPSSPPNARDSTADTPGRQIGILKNSTVLAPHQLSYSPFQIAFFQTGRVKLIPFNASDYPPVPSPGSSRSASWNLLMRPAAELRSTPSGEWGCMLHGMLWSRQLSSNLQVLSASPRADFVIAAPHTVLPGTQIAALSIEATFEDCTKRCSLHPECYCELVLHAGVQACMHAMCGGPDEASGLSGCLLMHCDFLCLRMQRSTGALPVNQAGASLARTVRPPATALRARVPTASAACTLAEHAFRPSFWPAGLASFPPGSCSMLWEASVVGLTSVAVLASGPGMRTLAGASAACGLSMVARG